MTVTSNIELVGDSGCDLNLDFDLNGVKEEVKCEEEKPEKYSSADSSSKADKPNAHAGHKPYTCDVCSRSFTQKSVLNRHKKIHSGEKTFVCSVCSKSFAQKCDLNRHLRAHNDDLPHSCLKCGQRFATEDAQKSHERRCKRRRYECYLCEYKSFTKSNLKRHKQAKHTGECKFQCGICGKKCIHKGNLNRHLAIHRNQFPFGCTKCRRGFTQAQDETAHEMICDRRQYQCYMCEYSTLYKTNLRNHMGVHHTEEKPFECKWCDKCFIRKDEAESHMKRIHHAEK